MPVKLRVRGIGSEMVIRLLRATHVRHALTQNKLEVRTYPVAGHVKLRSAAETGSEIGPIQLTKKPLSPKPT